MPSKKVKKIVLPVGGLGTRFLPATKSMPKEMLPVFNKPIIQYAYEEAIMAGIEDFIFITGRNKNAINNHFDHAFELQTVLSNKEKKEQLDVTQNWLPEAGKIAFIRQQQALGLGHAIWCARNFINDEPFAVILADEMLLAKPRGFLKEMLDIYYEKEEEKLNLIGTYQVEESETDKYGIVKLGDNSEVQDLVEKPDPKDAPSNLAIVGRYILQPEIFSVLEHQKPGSGNEVQLTDAIKTLITDVGQKVYSAEFKGDRYDCGSPIGWLEANIAYAYENAEHGKIDKVLKKFLG